MNQNYVKTPRSVWYLYKNGINIGQANDFMTARDRIKQEAGLPYQCSPPEMNINSSLITYTDIITHDVYEAKLEEVKK